MSEENQAKQVTLKAVYKELFSSFSMWLSLWYSISYVFSSSFKYFFYCFILSFREWFENRWIGREEATSYYKVKEVHAYEQYSKWCYKWRRLFQEYLKHLVKYCNSYSFLLLPKCLPKEHSNLKFFYCSLFP